MKRWIKRAGYLVAAAALCVGLFVLAERFRGQWALSRHLRSLIAGGEVLSVERLKPRPTPSDQNLLVPLLDLTNQLGTVASNLDFSPPTLRLISPGRAVAVVDLEEWSHDGTGTYDWNTFNRGLDSARETVSEVESAIRRPSYEGFIDYEKGFVDFKLKPIYVLRHASQLLSWSVLAALKRGDLDSAHRQLCALITLAAKQSPEPLIICQLVRGACSAIAFNATWQALQVEGWNDAQLASLQSAWQGCEFAKDMALAMEMERALTLDYYSQIRHSSRTLAFVIEQHEKSAAASDGAFGKLSTEGFVLHWIHLPLWRFSWLAQDELASLEQWDFMIERERIAQTRGWASLLSEPFEAPKLHWRIDPGRKDDLGWYDRLRFLFASENFAISDPMIRRTLERQTEQQMVLAVLGIRRYKLETGKLPDDIAELVPRCVAVVPHDFMSGQPLHYWLRPDSDGFLLYSVGEDGKDDQGDPSEQKEKKNYRQIWDGRDAVWPSPATKEEAQRAFRPKRTKAN